MKLNYSAVWASHQLRARQQAIADQVNDHIDAHPHEFWEEFRRKIVGSGIYASIHFEVPNVLEMIKNESDPYWTKDKLWEAVQNLGYSIDPSCSSNPANERWFIKWKVRK